MLAQQNTDIAIPETYLCPITKQILLEPVLDAVCETYEKEEIENWFKACREKKKPITSPLTKEKLADDKLISDTKTKSTILAFLDRNPSLWSEVYLSKKLQTDCQQAIAAEDKDLIVSLLKKEPRLLTVNNFALPKWVIQNRDKDFLDTAILANLRLRGQAGKFADITLLCAQANWVEGLRQVIQAQDWQAQDYYTCATQWLQATEKACFKMLLHEMQRQMLSLDLTDEVGNTLLHVATSAGDVDSVRLLLTTNMDVKKANQAGFTAEQIAEQNNNIAIGNIFKDMQQNAAAGQHLQLKFLQADVQEIRHDLQALKHDVQAIKQDVQTQFNQLFKGLRYAATPFFTLLIKRTYMPTHMPMPPAEIELSGHTAGVHRLLVLADGRLASASMDMTIKIWDIASRSCEQTLSGHTASARELVELADGRLASASEDMTIKIWDITSGKCEQTLSGHTEGVWCLIKLADGRLASASADKTIKIWDIASGKCEQTLNAHTESVGCLVKLADGRLASSSVDRTIKIWDIASGSCEQTLSGHTAAVDCLIVLGDGRLASSSKDRTIKIWDITSASCIQSLSATVSISAPAKLADGRLASSTDRTIVIWPKLASVIANEAELHIEQQVPECKMM